MTETQTSQGTAIDPTAPTDAGPGDPADGKPEGIPMDPPQPGADEDGFGGDAPQPAGPVRVPNVSAGARSGLDHEVIGANAQEAYVEAQDLDGTYDPAGDPGYVGLEVPEGDLDSRVEWVAAGETVEERQARADAVYAHEAETDALSDEAAAVLGGRMTAAVYGPAGGEQQGTEVTEGGQGAADVDPEVAGATPGQDDGNVPSPAPSSGD